MGALELLLLSLATWRLSHMIAREDGPWDVLSRLRVRAGAWYDLEAGWRSERVLGRLLICPLCQSIWWACVLYIAAMLTPVVYPVAAVLAISGASCIIELLTRAGGK